MEEQDGTVRGRPAWLRWLGVGAGTTALVMAGLWTQRAPIAENFIGRELNRLGVQANYDLVDIGLRTQRIEHIVLGDPASPDLTAQWVEVDIAFAGLTPQVAAVRAGGVRVRGALHDGVLRLGELDKFRDPDSKEPFSLPDMILGLKDARLSLSTDAGALGMQLDGMGNLRSGFHGTIAAAMPKVAIAGCAMKGAGAQLAIVTRQAMPHLTGPVRADALACKGAETALARPMARIDVTLGAALDKWMGHADLSGEALRSSGMVMATPAGRIDFEGSAKGTKGRAQMAARALSGGGVQIEQANVKADWSYAPDAVTMQGEISGRQIRPSGGVLLAGLRQSTQDTPVGPLGARLADAVAKAGQDNVVHGRFALAQKGAAGSLILSEGQILARSGARAGLGDGAQVSIGWPGRAGSAIDWALDGAVTSGGGGLPDAALRLARRAGGGFGGQLFVDPYAADGARLALEPVRFTALANGSTRFSTSVRLDGPLPDGAIRGLSMPVEGEMSSGGALTVNRRCLPFSILQARYGAFSVEGARQTICPIDGAMLAMGGVGGLKGGADVKNVALIGRSGESPMRLTADHARFVLGQNGFSMKNAALAIGPESAPVRLTAVTMDGGMTVGGFAGTLEGAGGQIGTVPLIVEQGKGEWRFTNGALDLKAAMMVRDSQEVARFNPLSVPDFALTLKNGQIGATGTLTAPAGGARVADVNIVHELSNSRGHADLNVESLKFSPALQPDDLTPLTRGVVANVAATINGKGRIAWTGSTVTSNGTFRTDNANLAAAFGPVEGLSGEIHFTDLIGMVTAPGQEVWIKSVNPGVEVRDGTVRYRLEAGQQVRIEGGGWPFSGGQLVLLPTKMDFSADVDRYMTFRVQGLDAGAFIQAMDLKNVSATGVFDGIMPLIFNAKGGRVSGGVLVARQQGMPELVMPEGVLPVIPCDPARLSGTLSYVGPMSNEQLGTMGKMAFDALKNLQYKCLTILMDGALDGEMVTNVVFNGVNRDKLGNAPAGIARSFIGLPFIFNVRISAPFRGLMGTAQSLIDPSTLIQNSVGDEAQDKMRTETQRKAQQGLAVQPLESDKVPNKGQP